MKHFALIIAALLPTAGFAQEWTAVLKMSGEENFNSDLSGPALTDNPYSQVTPWNGTEIYQSMPDLPVVDCATAQEFEIDHYVGDGTTYILQVLITFARRNDGTWEAISPDVYLDMIGGPSGDVSYSAFDGSAKVQSLTCDGDTIVARYSFRANVSASEGGPTSLLSGRSSASIALQPYADY